MNFFLPIIECKICNFSEFVFVTLLLVLFCCLLARVNGEFSKFNTVTKCVWSRNGSRTNEKLILRETHKKKIPRWIFQFFLSLPLANHLSPLNSATCECCVCVLHYLWMPHVAIFFSLWQFYVWFVRAFQILYFI